MAEPATYRRRKKKKGRFKTDPYCDYTKKSLQQKISLLKRRMPTQKQSKATLYKYLEKHGELPARKSKIGAKCRRNIRNRHRPAASNAKAAPPRRRRRRRRRNNRNLDPDDPRLAEMPNLEPDIENQMDGLPLEPDGGPDSDREVSGNGYYCGHGRYY